jgi:hypothetical protein
MKTKTLVIAAIALAATFMVAAPLVSVVNAAPNGDEVCVHNGNGADRCTPGQSSTSCIKTKGHYVCED